MQKKLLASAVLLGLGGYGTSASADLASGSLGLNIVGNLNPACLYGGTYPSCQYGAFDTADAGSYFNMDGSPAAAVDGKGPAASGLLLLDGTAQSYSTADVSLGNPYPADGRSPFLQDWDFFGAKGTNGSNGITVGAGDTEVSMSGWFVTWSEVPVIDMSGDTANFPTDTGIAALACAGGTCEAGEAFTLDYAAHVPSGDPSGFGGVLYELHLQGTVEPVPVPAAVWLFGSGLLGLVGVARRRKAA